MLVAVESHDCSLSEVVPLVRAVQADVRNVSRILKTESSRCILRMILTRFITRVLRNNHEEAIAVHCLNPAGREELRAQQIGYHTVRSAVKLPLCYSRRMTLSDPPFERTITQLVDAISNGPHTDRPRIFSDHEQEEEAGDDLPVKMDLHSHLEGTDDGEGGDRIGDGNSDDGELNEEPITDDTLSEEHMTGDLTEFVTPRNSSFPVSYRKAMQRMEGLSLEILLDL
jgi:hypothetical protein